MSPPATPEHKSAELPEETSPVKSDGEAEARAEATLKSETEGQSEAAETPIVNIDTLIGDLRASLASSQTLLSTQATRLSSLTDTETELSQLKDQYAFLAAAKEAVEKQLNEETKRRELAEDNVDLLRGQLEQARRGVGILQAQVKERKRLSYLPPGGLGLNMEVEEVLAEPQTAPVKTDRASKRASMLVGRGHRRQSSQSEPGESVHNAMREFRDSAGVTSPNLGAPRAGGLRELRLGSGNNPSVANPTILNSPSAPSHFEDHTPLPVPPPMNKRSSSSSVAQLPPAGSSAYTSPVKSEEDSLRAELSATRARLVESEEAREASEVCLKALRDFMAGGGTEGGAAEEDLLKTMRLPPLPTDKDTDDDAPTGLENADNAGKKGGWGFKLWKQGPMSPALSTAVEPPATPLEVLSPPRSRSSSFVNKPSTTGEIPTETTVNAVPTSSTPLSSFVAGWTKGVVPGTPAAGGEAKPAAPARSLSSFFSRKTEDSSKEKEKDLPPPPEEVEGGITQQEAIRGEEQSLEPSPSMQVDESDRGKAEEASEVEATHTAENEATGTPKSNISVFGTPKSNAGEIAAEPVQDTKADEGEVKQ